MKKKGLVVLVTIISVAINWQALLVGWWWVTPLIGLLLGLFLYPATVGFLASLCVGTLSWALPLAMLMLKSSVISVARTVESIIGLSSTNGVAILLLTVVLGCVLSLVGTWVGVASRKLFSISLGFLNNCLC